MQAMCAGDGREGTEGAAAGGAATGADEVRCPYEHAQRILAGKWSLVILRALLVNGPTRFNSLQRMLGTVTPGTLTKHLKALETAGLVTRHSHDTVPPCVEYALTPIGAELRPFIEEFERWSEKYAAQLAGCAS